MPEEKKKKRLEGAYNDASQSILDQNTTDVNALNTASTAYEKEMAEAQRNLNEKTTAAQGAWNTQRAKDYQYFGDLVDAYRNDVETARKEAEAQVAADKKAARWTGATELAASIANLIGTANGAENQQYRTFSQDWMKKADQDLNTGRARIENLAKRQRAMELRLQQMKMGDADAAMAQAYKNAETEYKLASDAAKRKFDTAATAAQMTSKANSAANELNLKGVVAQTEYDLKRQEMAQRNSQNQQSRADRLALHGLKLDDKGNPVADTDSEIYRALVQKNSEASTGSANRVYYKDKDGNLVYAPMKSKEYEIFIDKAYARAMEDPDFVSAYENASTNYERRSLLFNYASNDPELRAELDERRRAAGAEGNPTRRDLPKETREQADMTERRYNEFD